MSASAVGLSVVGDEQSSGDGGHCPSCGETASGRFCSGCGAALEQTVLTGDVVDPSGDEMSPKPQPARTRRRGLRTATLSRRTVLFAGAAVLVTALLGVLTVKAVAWVGESGLRAAEASSTKDFNAVVARLSSATTGEGVARAAGTASGAAERIATAAHGLPVATNPKQRAVASQLEAERQVLVAVTGLSGLDAEPLTTWGDVHASLDRAVGAEHASRSMLRTLDEGAAADLGDTTAMMRALTQAAGPALAQDAAGHAVDVLKTLQNARTTADLRTSGDAAGTDKVAVTAAADGLPEGDGRDVLRAYSAALGAVAQLAQVDGEHTTGWAGTRAQLAQTFGALAATASASGGTDVKVALDPAVTNADKVVQAAASAIADWKARTAAAVKARAADGEALTSYAAMVRSEAKTYEQLRTDLSGFFARVDEPSSSVTYADAYAFLSEAEQGRRNVRDFLVSSTVPEGMQAAHDQLVSVVDRSVSAVQSAYDGVTAAQDCTDGCYYRDTAAWKAFQAESESIGKDYGAALKNWEDAVGAATAKVTSRALPAKPNV